MKNLFFILFLALSIFSCTESKEKKKITNELIKGIEPPKGDLLKIEGKAQGTTYAIGYYSTTSENISPAIDSILLDIDNALSNWNSSSLLTELNSSDSTSIAFDDYNNYFSDNFRLSRKVWKETDGAFDPTLYPIINAWGFGLKNKENVTQALIDSLMPLIGFQFENIRLSKLDDREGNQFGRIYFKKNPQSQLDFNAIAQGYSVDVLANYMNEIGIESFMIELGGEVLTKGIKADRKPWRIGIDKPVDPSEKREFQAIAKITNKAIATSGSYRKFYVKDGIKLSHTIDPTTGKPVQHNLLSATVLFDNCGLADAYATAFMVMGIEKTKSFLEKRKDLDMDVYLIYTNDKGEFETYMTPGFEKIIE